MAPIVNKWLKATSLFVFILLFTHFWQQIDAKILRITVGNNDITQLCNLHIKHSGKEFYVKVRQIQKSSSLLEQGSATNPHQFLTTLENYNEDEKNLFFKDFHTFLLEGSCSYSEYCDMIEHLARLLQERIPVLPEHVYSGLYCK
jgi:hypothetical protein